MIRGWLLQQAVTRGPFFLDGGIEKVRRHLPRKPTVVQGTFPFILPHSLPTALTLFHLMDSFKWWVSALQWKWNIWINQSINHLCCCRNLWYVSCSIAWPTGCRERDGGQLMLVSLVPFHRTTSTSFSMVELCRSLTLTNSLLQRRATQFTYLYHLSINLSIYLSINPFIAFSNNFFPLTATSFYRGSAKRKGCGKHGRPAVFSNSFCRKLSLSLTFYRFTRT